MGESFQPALNTGTAKYSVALKLPPGTAGHAPSLSLNYEAGAANGPFGYGWLIGVGSVQRKTDRGIPTYGENVGFPRPDSYLDSNREELVPQADGYWFCKNEGAFVRYRQLSSYWEATLPNGTRQEFGRTTNACILDPVTGHVFSWLLEKETDTHGSVIVYSYAAYPGLQNVNQKYLASISYGPGAPPWENFHFVTFSYEDRPDWFEDCRAGFVVRTGKRLKRIFVGTQGPTLAGHQQGDFNGDGIADNLNRIYELKYSEYAGTNSHWSLLASIRLIGADGTTSLPPASFGYVVCDPPDLLSAAGKEIGAANEPALVMDNELAELADLNGDGLPDILRTGGAAHQACLNLGETLDQGQRVIRWASPLQMDSLSGDPFNFSLDEAATHLADMDGDGVSDLVHKAADGSVFYFPNKSRVGWGERSPMSAGDFLPPAPFGVADVRTADIDFDKRMDLIRGDGIQYQIWFNLGGNQYSERVTVMPDTVFDFSQPAVQIADLNGDRVPDIARIRPASVEVTAGLGYGHFAGLVSITIPDGPLDDAQVQKAKLTDINGDGLADLVLERAAPGELWYWLSLGNYTLSGRKTIAGMPTGIGLNTAIRWADLNGNGTTDLIYADQYSTPRLRTVDIGEILGSAPAPNMLVAISNGIGRVTLIGYEPSTKFALDDAGAGQPWPDPMPFPVTVVSAVTNGDSMGHWYVSNYRYHDGYYDPDEKQFRGFGCAEQTEVGDDTAPTLVTRSYFDTGRYHEALKGRLLRVMAQQEDGAVFWDETTTWTAPPRVLFTGTNGTNVTFVHPVATTRAIKELGRGTEKRLEAEYSYDQFGNVTTNANYGIVQSGDRLAAGDERITVTEYAINTNAWLLRCVSRQKILNGQGATISRQDSFYDDETFSAENWGSVSVGNLTLNRAWKDPGNPTAFVQSMRSQYDLYGNVTATLDPLAAAPGGAVDLAAGHVREIAFDQRFHSFPVRETIHVGLGGAPLVYQASYDEGFGVHINSTDFNGHVSGYTNDALARLTRIYKPGDAPEYPSQEFEYVLRQPVNGDRLVNYIETRRLDRTPGLAGLSRLDHYCRSRQLFDGLSRLLMTKQEAEPASGTSAARATVTGAVRFNARQQPFYQLNPFFTTLTGESDAVLAFENIESPGWTGQFHQGGSLATLPLSSAPVTQTAFDALLREIAATNTDGTLQRTTFEPLATIIYDEERNDPASSHFGLPSCYFYDGLNRLVQVDESSRLNDNGTPSAETRRWTTRCEYDVNDQLLRVIDSQNNARTFVYDGLKRRTLMSDPDRGTTRWVYDEAANLSESIDAKGQRITYTYDGANRVLTTKYQGGPGAPLWRVLSPTPELSTNAEIVYHYDLPHPNPNDGSSVPVLAHNTKGLLAWVEDLSGEEHFSYDARARREWTLKRIPDQASKAGPLVSFRTAFEHDSYDRLTRVVYPDNDEVQYTYNERGLLKCILGGPGGFLVSNVTYWPSQQQEQVLFGNGARTLSTYDARLRLKNLLTLGRSPGNPAASVQLINLAYEFDGVSNIRQITDNRPGTVVAEGDPRRNTQIFAYDDLFRLTLVQYSFNAPGQPARNDGEIRYRYDRIGNFLAQTSTLTHQEQGLPVANLGEMENGGTPGTWNRLGRQPGDAPGPHALTAIRNAQAPPRSYAYDGNGNLTLMDGLQCTWDFEDRLVTAENAQMRAEYSYDYSGRRVTKRVWPKASTNTVPAGEALFSTVFYVNRHFEVREGDAPTKYVWDGENRIARVTGSLAANLRLQQLRLCRGWNLCSTAITASNALQQLQAGGSGSPLVKAAFRWDPGAETWLTLGAGETLPAGAILWLEANTNGMVALLGAYSEPTNYALVSGSHFLPSAGLEVWSLASALSPSPSGDLLGTAALWSFDAANGSWLSTLSRESRLSFPEELRPGHAWFATFAAPVELEVPPPAQRLCFYHQDHLSSPTVVTDGEGCLVEETAYYPFGYPRSTFKTRGANQAYCYTQNEQDAESGLLYANARYLSGVLGRFLSTDPYYPRHPLVDEESSSPPRKPRRSGNLNLYSYAWNNPLVLRDTRGLAPGDVFASADEAVGDVFSSPSPTDPKETLEQESVSENKEYGGMVCKDPSSGYYFATKATWDYSTSGGSGVDPTKSPCPEWAETVGDYHTHGSYAQKFGSVNQPVTDPALDEFNSDQFSVTDEVGITEASLTVLSSEYKGYLTTPGGIRQVFDPETKQTRAIVPTSQTGKPSGANPIGSYISSALSRLF
ncbi:MAG TPA: toxin TcdB middle/N-terminal domain-containing protein [Verrucomicrobiae bacterium]